MIHKNLFGALALTALTLTAPVAAKAAPQHNRPRIVVNYLPAYTAIGHSSVHTGSVPSIHGIAGNDFFKDGNPIYCTQDTTVSSVGVPNGVSGQMSPRNLLTTTISDELRIATNFRSKTIGVAIKDRASILPAGHTANGAYWLDDKTGNFITSTYYMKDLPEWVKKFNARGRVAELLKDGWSTLYPINTYRESTADAVPYEQPWDKDGKFPATLPLNTAELAKVKGPGVIRTTPMGNTLTFEMAKAAIEGESLGSRADETDFLAMSHSATDYVGHRYGTFAVETEDTYLRLDKDLADFFRYLDGRFGRDGYLFILTADHAAAHNLTVVMASSYPIQGGTRSLALRSLRVRRTACGLPTTRTSPSSSWGMASVQAISIVRRISRISLLR